MNDGGNKGELHIIFGPMFAGKSTALIERVFEEEKKGKISNFVKPKIDSRYSRNCVVTHSGYEKSCYTMSQLRELEVEIGKKEFKEMKVIGIDEAQFFPGLYKFCEKNVDHKRKIVVVAGLDGDCRRKKFGAILDLIPNSDGVTKLTSRCNVCQKVALFTFKHSSIYGQEMTGGSKLYEPLCIDHHKEKHKEKQLKEFVRLKIGFLPNRKRIVMK